MKLVQDLIEYDKSAREAYQKLVQEQDHFDELLASEKERLLAFYTAQVTQEIAETKAEIERRLREKTEEAYRNFESSWAQIKSEFQAHHNDWLTTIVADCTKE